MLSQIEVNNYKSIAQASLSLGRETVIVGQNGVGKSNLIDAIQFVRDAVRDGLDHAITRRHGIQSIRRWSKTRPYNISFKFTFSGRETGEYKVTISSAGGDVSGIEEEATWIGHNAYSSSDDNDMVTCSFKRSFNGNISFNLPENPFGFPKDMSAPDSDLLIGLASSNSFTPLGVYFRGLYQQLVSCGAYSIYPNKIREPQSISTQEILADDGANLASIIRQMSRTSARHFREQLTNAIRSVLPIVEQIQIEQAGGFYVPVFQVRESDGGYAHQLNMSQISDGTLRMLGMLTAFYQAKAPGRITLEEPEQMIHPGLLTVLIESGRDYLEVNPERQILYTTHSPVLLDMFDIDSIIGANFQDGISVFAPMSDRQKGIVESKLFSAGELLVTEGIFES